MTSVEDLETLETKAEQVAVLHGGLEACSNANFPAIYVRLDNPNIHQWLMSHISGTQSSGEYISFFYPRISHDSWNLTSQGMKIYINAEFHEALYNL